MGMSPTNHWSCMESVPTFVCVKNVVKLRILFDDEYGIIALLFILDIILE